MVDIKDFINNMCEDSKIVYVFDAVHGTNVEESKKITLVNTFLLDDVIRILHGMVEGFKPEVFPTMSIILYHPDPPTPYYIEVKPGMVYETSKMETLLIDFDRKISKYKAMGA